MERFRCRRIRASSIFCLTWLISQRSTYPLYRARIGQELHKVKRSCWMPVLDHSLVDPNDLPSESKFAYRQGGDGGAAEVRKVATHGAPLPIAFRTSPTDTRSSSLCCAIRSRRRSRGRTTSLLLARPPKLSLQTSTSALAKANGPPP